MLRRILESQNEHELIAKARSRVEQAYVALLRDSNQRPPVSDVELWMETERVLSTSSNTGVLQMTLILTQNKTLFIYSSSVVSFVSVC